MKECLFSNNCKCDNNDGDKSCALYFLSKMAKINLSEKSLELRFLFNKKEMKDSKYNNIYIWLGAIHEHISTRSNDDKIIFDFSECSYFNEELVLQLAILIKKASIVCESVKVILPIYSSNQYLKNSLNFLYYVGFLDFLLCLNSKTGKCQIINYDLETMIFDLRKENLRRTSLIPIEVIDMSSVNFDDYIEEAMFKIETGLMNHCVYSRDKIDYMIDKVRRFIVEILDNVKQHAYDSDTKLAAVYINYREPYQTVFFEKVNFYSDIFKIPFDKENGFIEIFITDIGKGLTESLKVKKLSEAFKKTFQNGVRSSTSPTLNTNTISGLKYIYTICKESNDFIYLHDNRQFAMSRIPCDNISPALDFSLGKTYEHYLYPGLTVIGMLTWSMYKNEERLKSLGFENRKQFVEFDITKFNTSYPYMVIDMQNPIHIFDEIGCDETLNYLDYSSMYRLRDSLQNKTNVMQEIVECVNKQAFMNKYESKPMKIGVIVKPTSNLRKNRIASIVEYLTKIINSKLLRIYFCDVREEDINDYYYAFQNMSYRNIDNIGSILVSTRTGYTLLFKKDGKKSFKSDKTVTCDYIDSGKYDHLIHNLEKWENIILEKHISLYNKIYFIPHNVMWKTKIISGYLKFSEIRNTIALDAILRLKLERHIGKYNRNKTVLFSNDEDTRLICESINDKYFNYTSDNDVLVIGSVFHSGVIKYSGKKKVLDEYYYYMHNESNPIDRQPKILCRWIFDEFIKHNEFDRNCLYLRRGDSHVVIKTNNAELGIQKGSHHLTNINMLGNVNPMYLKLGHRNINGKHEFMYVDYGSLINTAIGIENEVYNYIYTSFNTNSNTLVLIENTPSYRKIYEYITSEKRENLSIKKVRFFDTKDQLAGLSTLLNCLDFTEIQTVRIVLEDLESNDELVQYLTIFNALNIENVEFNVILNRCKFNNYANIKINSFWTIPMLSLNTNYSCIFCNSIYKMKILDIKIDFINSRIKKIVSEWETDSNLFSGLNFRSLYKNRQDDSNDLIRIVKDIFTNNIGLDLYMFNKRLDENGICEDSRVVALCLLRIMHSENLVNSDLDILDAELLRDLYSYKNENEYSALLLLTLLNLPVEKVVRIFGDNSFLRCTNTDFLIFLRYVLTLTKENEILIPLHHFLMVDTSNLVEHYEILLKKIVNNRGSFHNKAIHELNEEYIYREILLLENNKPNDKIEEIISHYVKKLLELKVELRMIHDSLNQIRHLSGDIDTDLIARIEQYLDNYISPSSLEVIKNNELDFVIESYHAFRRLRADIIEFVCNSIYMEIYPNNNKFEDKLKSLITNAIENIIEKSTSETNSNISYDIVFRKDYGRAIYYDTKKHGTNTIYLLFDKYLRNEIRYLIENVRYCNNEKFKLGSSYVHGVVTYKMDCGYVIIEIYNKTSQELDEIKYKTFINKRLDKEYLKQYGVVVDYLLENVNDEVLLLTEIKIPLKEATTGA